MPQVLQSIVKASLLATQPTLNDQPTVCYTMSPELDQALSIATNCHAIDEEVNNGPPQDTPMNALDEQPMIENATNAQQITIASIHPDDYYIVNCLY